MTDRKRSSLRGGEGGGAPPFTDFSSFWEMIPEEREAARPEREAVADVAVEALVERETAAAEQRGLMADVSELKLHLAEERGRRSSIAGGEPWIAGSRAEPRRPNESAVQRGTVAGGDRITNPGATTIWLDGRMHIEPMRWIGSKSSPSPARLRVSTRSRNGDGGAVPVQSENDEYNVFRQMHEREREKLTIDRLHSELRARYDLLKEGKLSKTSKLLFLLLE